MGVEPLHALLLSIPLDYWTISPAGSEVESHWLF